MNKKYELEFTNSEKISVGTMFCIGQNYAKHIKEMGGTKSSEITVFIKPAQALVHNQSYVTLPNFSENVHHEVELVVVIGKDCVNVEVENVNNYIAGYGVGIDVTLRDIQLKAKNEGKPWAIAKGFYSSAPISKIIPASKITNNSNIFELLLKVNGEVKQIGSTFDMERSVEELISYLSKVFTLRAGDVIFTGTPEGVGQIKKGDKLFAELTGFVTLEIDVN